MAGLALVLAGGGLAGIAWETGFLLGLADENPDAAAELRGAALLLGTSAGSTVAAQLSSGVPLPELFERQLSPHHHEIAPDGAPQRMSVMFADVATAPGVTTAQRLQRVGTAAVAARTVDAPQRRAVIESRLPSHRWPERALAIPAIDVESGATVVFDRESGVDLVDAVAASCAVPGVWPPVTIAGRRYMDGGVATSTNLQLARGYDRVVVLTPSPDPAPYLFGGSLADDVATFPPGTVFVAYADTASVAAFGRGPLDPACRPPAALAGREQGRRQAADVATFLSVPRPTHGAAQAS
ncbi:patatin-like phospholipase family protein [Rhodococcus sp. NPDC003318]|uniref:patatin-like phospholipase family protein n=1 Tax=Rhodococcus sp. NPDC003318 TaxID=3364503 RepID=UPI00369848CE